jgi:hypothetical protein
MKKKLETLNMQFNIPPETDDKINSENIDVDLGGGVVFRTRLYKSRDEIPQLAYGAIIHNYKPYVVMRLGETEFVSCTGSQIIDFQSDNNQHSISCISGTGCKWGKDCKYFHDPIESASDQIQKFNKTYMVKNCPYFGHINSFNEQSKQLKFDNVKTLARYSAYMLLLINIMNQKKKSG